MGVYISILRGINVSGQKKIKMTALKALYEALGLEGVQTYIQSGNVVLTSPESDPSKLASAIGEAIEREFGYRVTVLVRSVVDWQSVAGNNPFHERPGIDPGELHVTFLDGPPDGESLDALNAVDAGPDEARVVGREVYLHCPNGYGRTKLSNAFLERKLGRPATTRNWNTVNKLLELARNTAK
jgi:uncharacterized protein (DUF1697 family)